MGKMLKYNGRDGFIEADYDPNCGDIIKYNKFSKHGEKYILDDETKAPSVTAVIGDNLGWNKQALLTWAKRQTMLSKDVDAILKDAGEIGTLLHILIEAHQRKKNVDTGDFTANQVGQALKCFTGYLNWANKVKFKPLSSEMVVVCNKQRVAGTVDCVGKIGDDLVLIDWKTSRYLYKEHKIQVAQYVHMLENQKKDRKFAYAMILRFDKNEVKYHQHKVDRKKIEAGIVAFQNCLSLHNIKKSV